MKGAVGGVFDDVDAQLVQLIAHKVAMGDVRVGEGKPPVTVSEPVVVEDVQVDGAAAIDGATVFVAGLLRPAQLPLYLLQLVQQLQRCQVGAQHDRLIEERGRVETPRRGLRHPRAALNSTNALRHPEDGLRQVRGTVADIAAHSDDHSFHIGGKDKKNARNAGISMGLIVDEQNRLSVSVRNHHQRTRVFQDVVDDAPRRLFKFDGLRFQRGRGYLHKQ